MPRVGLKVKSEEERVGSRGYLGLTLLHEVDLHDLRSVLVGDGAVVGPKVLLLGRPDDQSTFHTVRQWVLQDRIVRVI
jgi:hypothetical protein